MFKSNIRRKVMERIDKKIEDSQKIYNDGIKEIDADCKHKIEKVKEVAFREKFELEVKLVEDILSKVI